MNEQLFAKRLIHFERSFLTPIVPASIHLASSMSEWLCIFMHGKTTGQHLDAIDQLGVKAGHIHQDVALWAHNEVACTSKAQLCMSLAQASQENFLQHLQCCRWHSVQAHKENYMGATWSGPADVHDSNIDFANSCLPMQVAMNGFPPSWKPQW